MKKTIATAALAFAFGVASATETSPLDSAVYTLAPGETPTVDSNIVGTYSTMSGTATLNTNNNKYYAYRQYTMTVVLDWAKLNELFASNLEQSLTDSSFKASYKIVEIHSNNTSKTGIGIRFQNGELYGVIYQDSYTHTKLSDYVVDGLIALTVSQDSNGTVLYIADTDANGDITEAHWTKTGDGYKSQAEVTGVGTEAETMAQYNKIYIPNTYADAIQSIYVFDTAKTATEVTAIFNAAIPEPTTATLSLLALAGLAARRRRK